MPSTAVSRAGDTLRYEDAAARLTASLAEDAAAARTHTHIPTAAEVRQAAARFAGRAEDESEDNAVSPFETAEIPVPHSREYERAEDAPAVRAELAKKLTQATVACLVSGVAAAVMIVLAVLPVRPAALAMPWSTRQSCLCFCWQPAPPTGRRFSAASGGWSRPPPRTVCPFCPQSARRCQCILMLANGGYTANLPMLAGPAALVLCLNAAGRRLNAATVSDNFQLVSAKVEHAVAYRLKDAGALRAVSQGLAEPHPSVLVSRPTQIFRSFLANSAARGTSDKTSSSLPGCWAAAVWLPSSLPSSAARIRFWPPRSWRGSAVWPHRWLVRCCRLCLPA